MRKVVVKGIYAAYALRAGLGTVRHKFPPAVSVTREERERIAEMAKEAKRRRKTEEAPPPTIEQPTPLQDFFREVAMSEAVPAELRKRAFGLLVG
jgi:hypothetical protein